MRKNIVSGIDIGTHCVKVVIAQMQHNGLPPHIIGTGEARSYGMRHGYIVNKNEIIESIQKALVRAQNDAGIKIDRAYVSIGGVGLETKYSHGETIVSRVNSEVTDTDADAALTQAEARISREMVNRKVMHAIPVSYILDGQPVLGSPIGMHGSKLEVEAMFVTILEKHLNDFAEVVEESGIEAVDVMATPIATSLVTLTKQQKMVGCVLANIGAETLSIVVFEENTPISLKVFPIGSTAITNDIALEMRLPLAEAEQIKHGVVTGTILSQSKLSSIISSNVRNILSPLQEHLKKIHRSGLLPAGAILTGGGSGIDGIEEYARTALKLPAETAGLRLGEQRLKDASWVAAYGLCIWGASSDTDTIGINGARAAGTKLLSWISSRFSWFTQFLP